MLEGIGAFIKATEIEEFVDVIVKAIIWGTPDSLKSEAENRLECEYSLTNGEVSSKILQRLDDWIIHFEARDQTAFATRIRNLRSKIEIKDDDIPF